jgi:pimeloyl-ACP methyl ester carboxylesterase
MVIDLIRIKPGARYKINLQLAAAHSSLTNLINTFQIDYYICRYAFRRTLRLLKADHPPGKIMLLQKLLLSFVLLFITSTSIASDVNTIQFKSSDDILITADSYTPHKSNTTPIILLFHQAGSSRGEYNEIAPQLNKLGFNCIAFDLRSGEHSRGKDNQTSIRASNANLSTNYADALPDLIAALRYTKNKFNKSKIIAWGSSYSAALVLKAAGDHPELIDAVLSFSPGEYFSHIGKSKTWIKDSAKNINMPVFITSSRSETDSWEAIFDVIPSKTKTHFIPLAQGVHGSRALWNKYDVSQYYWQAVKRFLTSTGFVNKQN